MISIKLELNRSVKFFLILTIRKYCDIICNRKKGYGMKKISSTLIFCGVALIVGPFFGFTVRGQQDTDYIVGVQLGLISIAIGIVLNKLSNVKVK